MGITKPLGPWEGRSDSHLPEVNRPARLAQVDSKFDQRSFLMPKARSARITVVPLCCALFLSACGASASISTGDNSLPKRDLESQIKAEIGKQASEPIRSVACPEDLNAKVGATEKCALTYANGDRFGVSATVSSVNNDRAQFDIKVTNRIQ
jgi:uncharacterized protein DUF4333